MVDVGFDMDDTLVQFVDPFLRRYNGLRGTRFRVEDITDYHFHLALGITLEQAILEVDDYYQSPEFSQALPVDGVIECLRYHSQNSARFHVVSARPERMQEKTEQQLAGFALDVRFAGVHLTGQWASNGTSLVAPISKLDVCRRNKIEVLYEDSAKHAVECASYCGRVFLIDMPWNRGVELPGNVVRVKSWLETI